MRDLLNEFDQMVRMLNDDRIRYAVVGGLAMAVYGGIRATRDMDFLVHPDDMAVLANGLERLGYRKGESWQFKKSPLMIHRWWKPRGRGEDLSIIDILESGAPLHKKMIARAHTEKWREGIVLRVVRRQDLIRLKTDRKSHADRADMEFLKGSGSDE
jgi:hypothetical protein